MRVSETSASLLERLQRPTPQSADWQRFHDLYISLIRSWLALAGIPPSDTEDLTQEVLLILVQQVPQFKRQREGSFRAWLRQVVINRIRSWRKKTYKRSSNAFASTDEFLNQLDDPNSQLSQQWDRDHDKYVFERLLSIVRCDYEPETWKAFQFFAIEGRSATETASLTGLTESAIMSAKSRILKRLRQEAVGLLES